MFNPKLALAILLPCLGASVALACGPFFPTHLLEDRARTLAAAPANSFAFEAAHLVPPPGDALRAVEDVVHDNDTIRAQAEAQGLTDDQVAALRSMREAQTGEEAFARGAALPPALRLYTAGAVEWRAEGGDLDRAAARFQAVLRLPEGERRLRATWAAFMAAKAASLLEEGDRDEPALAQQERDTAELSRAFALVRELAISGAPDPLGLAVASYGEEAKPHLALASAYLGAGADLEANGLPRSSKVAEKFLHEVSTAVALYAEQAARGSQSGVGSLRLIARRLLLAPEALEALGDSDSSGEATFLRPAHLAILLADPRIERLLVAYVLALDDIEVTTPGDAVAPYSRKASTRPSSLLASLLDAVERRGIGHAAAADRLAALAYRIGRYDLAEKMAAVAQGPLASWVKAKLALQKVDPSNPEAGLAAAAAFYAEAAKAFPRAGAAPVLDDGKEKLLAGESGVLALARGEYVDALDKLSQAGPDRWSDAAYVAERVLTADELKGYVDGLTPSSCRGDAGDPQCGRSLRDLLARRLVREGRYDESLAYFQEPAIAAEVADYARALRDAEKGTNRVNRAQAWFAAAVLARRAGMAMMGYEGAPDFFVHGGDLQETFGSQEPAYGPLVRVEELSRFAASAAQPERRFHYRFIAADEAVRAANLLPPRSQAFAAVLCRGTAWMEGAGEEARAQELYHRYVDAGAYLPWAGRFGRDCPAPDFAAAAGFERRQFYRQARRLAGQYRWPALGGAGLALGLFLAVMWWWRASRSRGPSGG